MIPPLLPLLLAVNAVLPALCRRQCRSSFALWHSLLFFGWRTLQSGAPWPQQYQRLQRRGEADWLAWQHEQLALCQTLAAAGDPSPLCGQPSSRAPRLCQHLADGLLLYARRRLTAP
ncbi:hypothetical protein [Vogesella alkaliphila]|uniref:Uncharacterized protein n=1 Tax=Vogesella alkaliphila TaxID=1193621 RepID=A0ABQ2Z357_9NEIS|nr:hypothetical protein [Vogesella alkaliphila]GGY00195.1 hypothetical protein GCM10011290_30160 [Vogesella alkaliphila]